MVSFDAGTVPRELRDRPQWICWTEETRNDKPTKIPKQPDGSGENARANDMATWGAIEDATQAASEHDEWGIGFVFSDADPYIAIDIDGCIHYDDGRPRPEDWLPKLDTFQDCYVEISPSGHGLHIIARESDVPDWWTNQVVHDDDTDREIPNGHETGSAFLDAIGVENDHGEIEIAVYETGRFFTVTGNVLSGFETDTIESPGDLYEWLTAGWLVFNDELPFDTSDGDGDAGRDDDVDLSVYDVLSRSEYPEGERTEHPVHGSSTGANFMVDDGGETWRCWSGAHQCTGDAVHLVGMMEGLIECGEWTHSQISSETWTDVFNALEDRGLIEPTDRTARGGDGEEEDDDRPIPPDIDQDPEGVWDQIHEGYGVADDAEDKQLIRHRAARFLNRERAFAAHEESDTLYVYNPDFGVYEPRGEPYIQQTLVTQLNHHYTRHENNEIQAQIRGLSYRRPGEFGGPAGMINVSNGVLDLETLELHEHNPRHMFLASMPVEYDPDADCPLWTEFINDVIPKEIDRMKIQEYVGYCLMHWDLTLHKALFIVGPTASGKSTFLDTVRALLGPETVSSVTPQELVDERFAAVELFGAWANIRNDIPSGVIENTGKFKELVAGDPIKAERKYESTFTFEPKAKHLYSANHLPEASVDDDAFYRRIMLISFPSTVPINERDPELVNKLQDELSGILNWAIEGYQRLQENNGFTGARNPSEVRETWESWGSTVERFKQNALVKEPDGAIPKSLCHRAYVAYCEDEGLPAAVTQQQMTRKFKGDKDIQQGRRVIDNSRQRCYLGVSLKEEYDPRLQGESREEMVDSQDLNQFGTET